MESLLKLAVNALTVAAVFLPATSHVRAHNLTAVKCAGKLPTGRDAFAIVYDNNDSIYIFGGVGGGNSFDDAIKYSISQDTIELVGQLPHPSHGGKAVINKFGNIFYLAGVGGEYIYQYIPNQRSFVNVSTSLGEGYSHFAPVRPDIDTALLFGGESYGTSIVSLNLNTLEMEQVAQLPGYATYPAAIWVNENDAAYIFDGWSKTVQKYFWAGNRAEMLALEAPIQSGSFGVAWDGKYGYLVGRVAGGNPSNSLVQFDPAAETFAFIPVDDYEPVDWTTVVYIEELNRIYMFGGNTGLSIYHDEIWYIDLDPLSQHPPTTTEETPIPTMDPDIFDCVGRPYSNYPYPGDCTRFVICREDHGYAFDCPEPLHFDPVNRHCTFPDKAGCELAI